MTFDDGAVTELVGGDAKPAADRVPVTAAHRQGIARSGQRAARADGRDLRRA